MESTPSSKGHVLLVEDEPLLARFVSAALVRAGYAVVIADDVDPALAHAHTTALDFLVTDVHLPSGGGVELAEQLRAIQPAIRVVFVSGVPVDALPSWAVSLRKPFRAAQLLALLQ